MQAWSLRRIANYSPWLLIGAAKLRTRAQSLLSPIALLIFEFAHFPCYTYVFIVRPCKREKPVKYWCLFAGIWAAFDRCARARRSEGTESSAAMSSFQGAQHELSYKQDTFDDRDTMPASRGQTDLFCGAWRGLAWNFCLRDPKHTTHVSSGPKHETTAVRGGLHTSSELFRRICDNLRGSSGRGP